MITIFKVSGIAVAPMGGVLIVNDLYKSKQEALDALKGYADGAMVALSISKTKSSYVSTFKSISNFDILARATAFLTVEDDEARNFLAESGAISFGWEQTLFPEELAKHIPDETEAKILDLKVTQHNI